MSVQHQQAPDGWQALYRRAFNEARDLTNFVESRPDLRIVEKRLAKIEEDARAMAAAPAITAATSAQEPVAWVKTWHKGEEQHAELWEWEEELQRLPDGYHALYAALTAAPPAQPQEPAEGWKLVPVEPTPEMVSAGRYAYEDRGWNGGPAIYRAMLAASPPRAVEPPQHIRLMAQSVLHTIADAAHPREDIDLDAVRAVATYITAKR